MRIPGVRVQAGAEKKYCDKLLSWIR